MDHPSLTIAGGGNTAFSLAANLTLRGYSVTLFEVSSHQDSLAPILDRREITLDGVAEKGVARIATVTIDPAEAARGDLIVVAVPSYAHQEFARLLAPHLREGHLVVLAPGNCGSLAFAKHARDVGRSSGIAFAEFDTAPYVCRRTGPAAAHIWGIVTGLGVGVYPASRTAETVKLLSDVFPGIRPYPDALACGLSATNPIVHPAGVLMNAGRVEYSRGEFYFYEEGVTPGVVRAIKAVDSERIEIGAALGYDLDPVEQGYWRGGFGPRGDLWATINGSRMLTQLRAPGSLETRWLTEDIPYGIATWALIGEQYGVDARTMRALTDLGSVVTGKDFWASARTPKDLGIVGMIPERLSAYLQG